MNQEQWIERITLLTGEKPNPEVVKMCMHLEKVGDIFRQHGTRDREHGKEYVGAEKAMEFAEAYLPGELDFQKELADIMKEFYDMGYEGG